MLDTLLSPQAIAFLTTLGAPAGVLAVEASGALAQSIAVTGTTKGIIKFFRQRLAWKQLRDIYVKTIQDTLKDKTIILDDDTRENLFISIHTFENFSLFINKYNNLCDLPFHQRRDEVKKAFRKYIQNYTPNISDVALEKIEGHFSTAAFRVIDNCIKKSPEAFYKEAKESLDLIQVELEKNAQNNHEILKNLEILKASANYFQKFAPSIGNFSTYLSNIDSKIDGIRRTQEYHTGLLNSHSESLGRLECGVKILNKKLEASIGKSQEYVALTKELNDLKETYHALNETNVPLRLKYSQKIEDQKKLIQSFEQDVIRLAETFKNISIDSERLRRAQKYFEAGEFKLTADLLSVEDLESDQQRLLSQRKESVKTLRELNKQLRHNAMEYLVKAQATGLVHSNPNRFDEAKKYYLQSIRSFPYFNNLYLFADFLQTCGQFNEAESLYLRILTDFRTELSLDNLATTLNDLAVLHWDTNEYTSAETEYTEALSIRRNLANTNPKIYSRDVAQTLSNLALLHSKGNMYQRAEEELVESLKILRNLSTTNPSENLPSLATTLHNLAILHWDTNEYTRAEEEYTEALAIRRNLAIANPNVYLSDLADTLDALASLHKDKGEFKRAEEEYADSLTIRRNLATANPVIYLSDMARILNNLGSLHNDVKENQKAEEEYAESLAIRRNLATANPKVYLSDLADTLNNLAILHKEKKEYERAEREFAESLAIYRNLTATNPAAYLPNIALALNNIAVLHSDINEQGRAEEEYTESLTIYRDLITTNPAVYLPKVAMTLNNLAVLHEEMEEYERASGEYAETLAIYRNLMITNPAVHQEAMATTLNNLARLHAEINDYKTAEGELSEVLTICRNLAITNPDVHLQHVAAVLNNLASLHSEMNNHKIAEEELLEVLTICRNLATTNPDVHLQHVAEALNNLASLHKEMNEVKRAEAEFAEAQTIQKTLDGAEGSELSECGENSSD